MPCYLFTYHAYGSWMPDRPQGYVQRKQGILPPDAVLAQKYRAAMEQSEAKFTSDVQIALIDSLLESREKQSFQLYFVATDITHVHAVVGWRDNRKWLRMRSTIKGSLSRYLNGNIERREWFVDGGSRRHVKEQEHFDHLVSKYLPRHNGWKWSPEKGKFR